MDRARVVENIVEDAVGKDLKGLGSADCFFAVSLDLLEVMQGEGVGA